MKVTSSPVQPSAQINRAVIATAIPLEFEAVREHLADLCEYRHPAGTIYEEGKFSTAGVHWRIGVVETGVGLDRAALEVSRAIEFFKPSCVLFVGVAGGVKDVELGDVVAATKIYGYESGKDEEDFSPRPSLVECDYSLVQIARQVARRKTWQSAQQASNAERARMGRAIVGPIAAGEKVVGSTASNTYRILRQFYGDTLAVEMEGLGFARAAIFSRSVPFLVVRGISDLLNGKAQDDAQGWQLVAASRAASFAFAVLSQFHPVESALEEPGEASRWKARKPAQNLPEGIEPERSPVTRYGGQKGEDGGVATEVQSREVRIRIDIAYEKFGESEKSRIMKLLAELLEMEGEEEIRIRRIEPGSTLLTLVLPPDKAERLVWLVNSRTLKEFGISEAELLKARETDRLRSHSPVITLRGIHHVEMYVANAYQAAHFYRTIFGFEPIARLGPATGARDRTSFALAQGGIRLVVTSGLTPDSPILQHVQAHGDSISDIAFAVDDATQAFEAAVSRGATPIMEPTIISDEIGQVVRSTVSAFGDTVHSFIQTHSYTGHFLPGFHPLANTGPVPHLGLREVDHLAVHLEEARLEAFVEFYTRAFDLHRSEHDMLSSEWSSINTTTVSDPEGKITILLSEPARYVAHAGIEEYLEFHQGAGSQHIAFSTEDIFSTVRALQLNGIRFLRIPQPYYEVLEERVGPMQPLDLLRAAELGVLVDRDADGILFQAFTEPLEGRPTLFIEVVERRGAKHFGGGNTKALFDAFEIEKARSSHG